MEVIGRPEGAALPELLLDEHGKVKKSDCENVRYVILHFHGKAL